MDKYYCLIAIIILSVSCIDRTKEVKERFGQSKNTERQKLNLVPIDPSFELIEDPYERRRFVFVHKNQLKITSPEYLRKIIMLDSFRNRINYEQDYFAHPAENKEMVVSHDYLQNITNIVLQGDSVAGKLTPGEADSVLTTWKIKLNPFRKH